MKTVKFKNVIVYLVGSNGEMHTYHHNNEYKNNSLEDIVKIFDLEPFYMATTLDGYDTTNMKSFNTYNWNAPYTLCGVSSEDIYEGIAIVNVHLGGDVRGNYSEPYICEDVESLFMQSTILDVELTNGETFSFSCDNNEGYFDFDNFDAYYIDFDKELNEDTLKELEDKNEL